MLRDSEPIQQKSPIPGSKTLATSQACDLLRRGKIRDCYLFSNGSNYVFLVTLVKEEMEFKAVYKPRQGEAPLWDFAGGTLYKREYAAFIVSEALGWYLIPPTVIRGGPYGVGSMQWFIDTAGNQAKIKDTSILKQVALFDYLTNNADRKAGHFMVDRNGRLWLIDHGVTFNAEPKLRTVLWDFSGQPIPGELLADVKGLLGKLKPGGRLREALRHLLDESEVEALELRINAILGKPVFVYPGPHRSVPWPWY